MVLPCIIDAAKRIVESCAGPAVGFIKTEVGHLLNYSANLDKLRKEVENLSDAATSVQNRIEEAENNRGETVVDAVVERWLSRRTSLIEEASKIVNDEDRSETERCLMGLRPNLWACYQVSKSASRVIDEAVELRDEGTRFDRVANIDYSRCSGVAPIPDFKEFESRDQVSSDIVAALEDSSVNMVGVYGLGGVGKTTLVEKVAAQLQKDRTFNFVVMAVVSHKPDLKRIQGEIAEALKIKLDAETEKGRALQLKERLEKRGKVLIILDDIWERIELKDIGIPFASGTPGIPFASGTRLQLKEKGGDDTIEGFSSTDCKILMTSRSEKVLYNEMGSTSNFPLQVLSKDDAWNLFEKTLGGTAPQDPTWLSIATQVVERCSGMPILLVIVSRTLKDGDLQTWKNALEQLKTFDRDELVDQVYLKIELSYNHLKGEEMKSLFRLCGLLNPGGILVKDLLKYAMGLRLFKSCNRLETSRNRLHKYLHDLKAFGLLQDGNSKGTLVRMHDVVHKFAAFVGFKDHRMFTEPTDKLEEWPPEDELEQFTAISLLYCHLPPELPVAFDNPKLESFIMGWNKGDSPLKIPDNFFVRMKGLRLIDLSKMSLSPVLPSSINVLVKLQTLCLYYCELDDISIIGELSMLQVLSLVGSTVVHLPKELGKLTRLKLLDLRGCSSLRRIASDVLSKLTSLEDLCMENSFNHWEEEGYGSSGETTQNASLGELKNLLNLIDLDIHIPHAEMFPKDLLVFEKLERFRIFIGEEWKWDKDYRASRTLKLKHTGCGQLEYEGIKALMGRAEDVYLQQLDGFISLCELDLDYQGFPHMKYLNVQNGVQIQYIVNSFSRCIVFPNLKSLLLKNLTKLEKICHGGGQLAISGLFKNLSIIKVERCDALKDLFSSSLARGLLCLKEIGVINCQNMETVVSQENHQSRADNQDHEDVEFVELRALTLGDLPHFLNFYSILTNPIISSPAAGTNEIVDQKNQLTTPTPLFTKKVVFPKLEELTLLRIRVEKIWDVDQLAVAAEGWGSCFQNLTSFILDGCRNISYLLTSSMVKSLSQLKKLEVSDCKSMKEIVFTGTGEIMSGENMCFPKLKFIKLKSLPKLKRFCNAEIIKCPSLQRMWIQDCVELGTFTTNYRTTDLESNTTLFDQKVAFPNLEELTLEKNMDSVKKIWGNELYPNSFSKLKTLKIEGGGALLNIFPSTMLRSGLLNLENFAVSRCNSLEEVFDVKMLSMNEKEGQGALPPTKLTTITIQNLPKLKQVWNKDPHGLASFQNLGSVQVEECPSLTSLFPISVALGLHQLEKLRIESCEVMEEIVSMDEESDQLEVAPNFMLPKVTSLHLQSLPELKRFYTGAHTSEWPALNNFWMHHCDKVDMFVPNELKSIQEEACIHRVSQLDLQPFISFSKIIPNLEEVSLRNKDIEMICDHDLFMPPNKLKFLHVHCFHEGSENFPIALIRRFLNLEELIVACSNLKQLFPSQLLSDETNVKTLARIPQLKLDNLREMTHIWGEESQLDQILPYLETLEVWGCDRLMNLAPSNAALFPNLTYLDVVKCKELVKLLTFSTANSLVQLTYMHIRECDLLKEIVVKDEGETTSNIEDTIVFPKLEIITLQSLTSLTSFCSATNCNFKFPSLGEVIVAECPKMEFFSHGVLTTPNLSRVWVKKEGEEEEEGRWEGNLNSTIRQMYKEMVGFSSRKQLKLAEFPLLKDMWLDEHPLEHFSDLQFLEVEQCTFVSYVISSDLLLFLNNLEELRVADCNSLEEVFDGYSKELELRNNNINVGLLSKLNKFYLCNLPSLRHVWPENFERIVDLKNLTLLNICNCSSLRYVFTPSVALCLVQLQEMQVKNCVRMEAVIINREKEEGMRDDNILIFPQLNSILLESLSCMESFYSGNGVLECPYLEKITMIDCLKLETFTSTSLREKDLTTVEANDERLGNKDLHTLNNALFNDKVVFLKLEELTLLRIRVEKIWDVDQLAMAAEGWRSCFQNLTSFILDGCRNISYLLTSSMVKTLSQLKKLEVSDCKSMKEIVFTGTGEIMCGEIMSFPKLNFIKLKCLPKLKRFCNAEIIKCPSLQRMWIQDCVELGTFTTNYRTTDLESNTTLFDQKVAFPNLEELTLEKNMDSVKKIWGNELYPDSFSKLKTLKIEGGGALLNIFPSIMLRSGLLNLENLSVSRCNSLEEVFDVKMLSMNEKEGQGALPPTKLTTITIQNLPKLKQVWNKDPHGLASFQNLGSVHVEQCPSLTSLFPISVALGLHQLEKLRIESCEVMEEIVSMDEESDQLEAAPNFMLPKVTSLVLHSLPKLKRFYTRAHTSEWRVLKTFYMYHCDKVDVFVPNELKSIQEEACIHRVSQLDLQPFISFSKIIPNLEELSLRNKDIEMICDHDLFMPPNKLKILHMHCFHEGSEIFPIGLIRRFLYLEKLVVACSNFKKLFPSQLLSDVTNVKTLARIPHLRLDGLREMTHIWGDESQLDQILPYLESLEVWSCHRLMNLAPSNAALFPNLTYLDVWKCKELVKLLTFSSANSLVQLTKMRIRECDSLKEIVVKDEGETTSNIEDTIVFPKLERITLQSLTSLTSFCSATNCNFKFPSLGEVIVAECPKMEFFSHGVLTTPNLSRVWVKKEGEEEEEGRWEGNLNSTIRQMYKEMVGFSSRKQLKLAEFPLLKDMWLDEHPLEHFSDLQFLEVEQCTFVSYVISSDLLLFLNNLEELRVADCNSLEEVFDGYSKELELRNNNMNVGLLSKLNKFYLSNLPSLRHVWPENFERILDLRNLTLLNICNCSSLRYVFTPSVALCLVQLREMQVKNCVRMEAVIINRVKGEGMRDDNILIFPQLNSILLQSLPCMESFYSGNGVLEYPYLEKITMIDCPKLETFTSTSLGEKDLTTIEANDERLGNKDLHTLNKALFNDKVAFPSLEKLQITEMNGLKRIWQDELYPSSILKLKTLKIENGRALLTIFPTGLVRRALNLESVIISNCESVEELFGVQMLVKESKLHGEVQETQLRTLHISELPKLKHVWSEDPHGLVSFQNLRSVSVKKCPSLTSLFPISVALGLQQLEELQIQSCAGMEEIVSNTNIEAGHQKESCEPEFVFPKVTFLKLWRLPELKRFYPGAHTSEWPILNDLSVCHCDKIDLFGPQFQSIGVEGCKEEQLAIQVHEQPFISLTKIIPNLEKVSLRRKDVDIIYDGVCLVLTDKVKVINLQCFHDDSQGFPVELLQRFQNLNKLVVSCSDFKQLFTSELLADETNVKILSRIPQLRIDLLPEMMHIWDEESDKLYQILQNLEHLEVWYCNRLINLAPSTALFPNLTYLEVKGCEQLIKLVTPSTAKSFVQLTEMRISNCDSLTVIVAIDEEDTSDKDIVFGKLETLALHSLTSLTSFCSTTNCNFQFPSLDLVLVAECTEMEFFSKGALSTPKLRRVWVKKKHEEVEGRWEGELDSTLRLMYKKW